MVEEGKQYLILDHEKAGEVAVKVALKLAPQRQKHLVDEKEAQELAKACRECEICERTCPNLMSIGTGIRQAGQGNFEPLRQMVDECIGCGKCVIACPYKARTLDSGAFHTEGTPKVEEYDTAPTWEYSRKWPREKNESPIGNARKCHFCYHRIKNGMVPMCVSTCICRANFFGDPEDKESLIYKMLKNNKVKVLKEVTAADETKVKSSDLKGMSAVDIAKKIGYPGATPVFADAASTKPRLYYILP